MNHHTIDNAFHDLDLIRQQNPVVHNLTNLVVMQTTANLLLSIGASPIMAHAREELADIVAIANALVINIGTLDNTWVQAIECAQREAMHRHLPIILDPVGAGASGYRTAITQEILHRGVHILRGNPSEIMALTSEVKPKGVDSRNQSDEAIDAAKILSDNYKCTVVISGKTDVVISNHKTLFIPYGTSLFTKLTGMGCSATALIGAFAAVNQDYFHAATHAMTLFTLAGQLAARKSQGPASFYSELVDGLFQFKKEHVDDITLENVSD
jgi:hydroxyethylthiazole kinase